MKKQLLLLIVLSIYLLSSCTKEKDRCEGMKDSNSLRLLSEFSTESFKMDKNAAPFIYKDFLYFNGERSGKNVVVKWDLTTNTFAKEANGHISSDYYNGFLDNKYSFSRNYIPSEGGSYFDIEAMEYRLIEGNNLSRRLIKNEIYDDSYLVYFERREIINDNRKYELFKFLPGSTAPESLGEFVIDYNIGGDLFYRKTRLWKNENEQLLITVVGESNDVDRIVTYNITKGQLLYDKKINYFEDGVEMNFVLPRVLILNDKILIHDFLVGKIQAYDIKDGNLLWSSEAEELITNRMIVNKDTTSVYVGRRHHLSQYNIETGEQKLIIDGISQGQKLLTSFQNNLLLAPIKSDILYMSYEDNKSAINLVERSSLCTIDELELGTESSIFMIHYEKLKHFIVFEKEGIYTIEYK